MNEQGVEIEAPTFEEAVRDAAHRLGVDPAALGLDVLDPGRSAASSGGYRPVKLRAWIRPPSTPPDGARPGAGRGPRTGGDEHRRGPARHARPTESYGPPPPPLDPALITPEHVERARQFTAGIMDGLGSSATVAAERTTHGIRVSIDAGDRDPLLIGPEGQTLAAIQYLVSRMMRSRSPDEGVPRLEADVAGYRDRRNEELRELARELIEQARRTGEEALSDPLPPSERRILHLEVAETPGMTSLSIGAHVEKRVVVRLAEPGPDA